MGNKNIENKSGNNSKREQFSSSIGFVLAMTGSAIGLGNIWKFPYITGINGGGAFVLLYFISICAIGMPLIICEMAIGRKTRKNPYGAFEELSKGKSQILVQIAGAFTMLSGISFIITGNYGFATVAIVMGIIAIICGYKLIGFIQILLPTIILSYYSVVGGWVINYMLKSFTKKLDFATAEEATSAFGIVVDQVGISIFYQIIFLALCMFILYGGVKNGIEKWSKILMPILAMLLTALIVRNMFLSGAMDGVEFFLKPDFQKLNGRGVLEALSHAFYTLGVGMGIVITFGSYLTPKTNITKAAFQIIIFDTFASVLAGLAIFTAVFAMGFNAASGPTLIFEVLPVAFNNMPGGSGFIWSGIFFLSVAIAAVTSGVSLIENPIAFLMDRFKIRRVHAISICFVVVAILGTLSSLSVAHWDNLRGLKAVLDRFFGAEYIQNSFFNLLDFIASNWLLPISGLFSAILVGWVWSTQKAKNEVSIGANNSIKANLWELIAGIHGENVYNGEHNYGLSLVTLWSIFVRFLIPIVIVIIFLHEIL